MYLYIDAALRVASIQPIACPRQAGSNGLCDGELTSSNRPHVTLCRGTEPSDPCDVPNTRPHLPASARTCPLEPPPLPAYAESATSQPLLRIWACLRIVQYPSAPSPSWADYVAGNPPAANAVASLPRTTQCTPSLPSPKPPQPYAPHQPQISAANCCKVGICLDFAAAFCCMLASLPLSPGITPAIQLPGLPQLHLAFPAAFCCTVGIRPLSPRNCCGNLLHAWCPSPLATKSLRYSAAYLLLLPFSRTAGKR